MANPTKDSISLVSVVVRTHNRSELLARTLNSLAQQTYSASEWELVVVDNASTDDTREVVQRFEQRLPTVRYVYEPTLGAARARLVGLQAAQGQIIAWIDDDCIAEPDWLEHLVAAFDEHDPVPAIVGGKIELDWENGRPTWMPVNLERALGYMDYEEGPRLIRAANGGNMAWRAELIRSVHDHRLGLGPVGKDKSRTSEDSELSGRIREQGGIVWFTPKAVVRHFVPAKHATVWYLFRRYFAFGVSDSVRYQYNYVDDRIDSSKRLVKAVLRLISATGRLLLNLPKRVLQHPHDVLIDLVIIVKWFGFIVEEGRFQLFLGRRKLPTGKINH